MSALLGRIPSAVGYQPTLATDLGTLQERITSTHKGSITSVQVTYLSWSLPPCFIASYMHAGQGSVRKVKADLCDLVRDSFCFSAASQSAFQHCLP